MYSVVMTANPSFAQKVKKKKNKNKKKTSHRPPFEI